MPGNQVEPTLVVKDVDNVIGMILVQRSCRSISFRRLMVASILHRRRLIRRASSSICGQARGRVPLSCPDRTGSEPQLDR